MIKEPRCRCSRCKGTEGLYKTNKSKQGVQYYMCRSCNTIRCARYRATKVGKGNIYKAVYKSIEKHRERQRAREKLGGQVRSGKIPRPVICSMCEKKKRISGHHPDYSKPLEVIWVCVSCHADIHKKLKENDSVVG